jgi:hypothetical protein
MENKIINSLLTKFSPGEHKPHVELKPLDIPGQPSAINKSDSLVKKIGKAAPVLMNPLLLFRSESRPPLKSNSALSGLKDPRALFNTSSPTVNNIFSVNSGSGNVSIIEPGTAIENINALKQFPGKQWLGKLASNGNREAAVIIPEGVDYNKPFEVIYYFHGHDGKISRSLTDGNYGLKEDIKNMAKERNIIVVVPQGPAKPQSDTWMNGKNNEDMQQFEQDTLNIIKERLDPRVQIGSITVKGHSAGGQPIKNAANEGKLTANRVDFLDASYGTWATQAYNNLIIKNPETKFNLFYIPGSQTQADALSLRGKKGVTLTKANVDHSSVPKTFFTY